MAVKKTATGSDEYAENIIDTVRKPLIVLDHDLRVVTANRSFYEFFKACLRLFREKGYKLL